jgi:selenide,water dikinase
VPGGSQANRRFVEPRVDWGALPEPERLVLADAQTSGGLLVALPENRVERFVAAAAARGTLARAVIGRVLAAGAAPVGRITLRGRLGGGALR